MTKGNKQSTRWQINSRIRVIFQYCVRIFLVVLLRTQQQDLYSIQHCNSTQHCIIRHFKIQKGVCISTDLNKCLYGNLEIGLAKARLGSSRLLLLRWSLSSSKSYPQIQSMPDCIRLYSKDHLLKTVEQKKEKYLFSFFFPTHNFRYLSFQINFEKTSSNLQINKQMS